MWMPRAWTRSVHVSIFSFPHLETGSGAWVYVSRSFSSDLERYWIFIYFYPKLSFPWTLISVPSTQQDCHASLHSSLLRVRGTLAALCISCVRDGRPVRLLVLLAWEQSNNFLLYFTQFYRFLFFYGGRVSL